MPRGFGSTFGVGSTDSIITKYTKAIGSGQRTYSVWVYRNNAGGSSAGRIFDKNTIGNGTDEELHTGNTNATYNYRRGFSTTPGQWTVPNTQTGVWTHLMIAYDSGSTANNPVMYVNGVLMTVTRTAVPSGTPTNTTDPFALGNRVADNVANWDGMIAHWSIWDGVLLGQREATALAAGVNPVLIQSNYLAAYLPLDGLSNPEQDLINFTSSTITGTKRGTTEPPASLPYMEQPYDSLPSFSILAAIAAYQQANRMALSASEIITAAISARQVNDFSFISASEIIVSTIAAYQLSDFAILSVSQVIAAAIAAYQVENSAAISASELFAVAISACQANNFGAMAVDEIIAAIVQALQQSNNASISIDEIVGAALDAYQKTDAAVIRGGTPTPTVIACAHVSDMALYGVTVNDAALYGAEVSDSALYGVALSEQPLC